MRAHPGSLSHLAGCGWFWAWAVVGVGFGLGISQIGILTLPLATLAVILMTRRRPIRGAFGVATGAGSVLLYIAYINRSGEFYDPVHWLIPGLVLFFGGIAAHTWESR
jgi:hypothetical protein